jgi:radical SAM protein with 4Fe4S-binding SPASM domain
MDIHRKGFLVSCNLAHGIDWSNSQNTEILNRELHKLIDFYLKNPNIEPCSMLEMGISNVGQYEENAVRYCGTGKYMRAYDVDGRAYPCQFFMPLSIGEEKAAAVKDISIPDEYLPDDEIDEKCRNCVVRSACPNCFGSNYASTGSIYKRDDNMCRLTKIILKARSYFRAKQWELGQLHETPDELQMLLRAIIKIQEELEVS